MTGDLDRDSRAWLRRFWLELLLGSLTFALGLAVAAWGLRALAERYAPLGRDRLSPLMRPNDYEVVVIGSSMTGVGFRHEHFEAQLHDEHGRTLRSYGLGMGALRGPELDFYVRRVLELPMPKLRWLLIDVTVDQDPELEEKNWFATREIEWQTPRQFALVASHVMGEEKPLEKRLTTLWPFARHFGINALNIGRGHAALEGFDRMGEPEPERRQPPDWRLDRKASKAKKYRENVKAHESAVRRLIASRRRGSTRSNALPATWRDAAAERGVEVAYVVGPTTFNAAFPAEVPGKPDLRVFDFNDPREVPHLYEITYHYDTVHLTEPGAESFSRDLADALDEAMNELERR